MGQNFTDVAEDLERKLKSGHGQRLQAFSEEPDFHSSILDVPVLGDDEGNPRNPVKTGGLLVPTEREELPIEEELPVVEELPVDTYTPEDQANAEETQVSDEEMEDNYLDFVINESLSDEEQNYLAGVLEGDNKLSEIVDKVFTTAAEFSGSGEIEGPGTGVSDSIPARLSDGEFVFTEKATNQLGADNLQEIMDDAERAYDGGLMRENRYLGGALSKDELELRQEDTKDIDEELRKLMTIKANKAPSLI